MSAYAFFLLLLLTDSSHHWFYRKLDVRTGENGYFKFQIQHGIGFYLFYAVLLLTSFFCFYLAWKYYQNTKDNIGQMRKKRAHILLQVSLLPLMIAILYLFEGKSIYSPVCIGIGLSALLLIHALNHFNYMEVIQNAKALVADNMDLGLLIFDTEEHFLEANQFMEKHFPEVWETPDFVKECEEFRDVMTGKRSKILWKGRNYNCQKSEVRTQSGVLIGYALTVYDITDLEEYSHQLEILKEEAEKANAQKTKFLTNVTHEIRTPMNGIMGMLRLAKEKMEPQAPPMQYLDKTEELAGHLLALINDILDMSRIEAGKVELEHKPFSLNRMRERLYDMFAKNLEARNIRYAVNFEDITVDYVVGDELRLDQVIINFLSNAVKFTSEGEIIVTFRQMMIQEQTLDLMISVRDTGIGMDPSYVQRIFRPFDQEHSDTVKKYGGTGLGMAITDQIVKLMGGEIVIHTAPGKGTDFSVFLHLPIADEASIQEAAKIEERQEEEVSGESVFYGRRILLAEDNEINAMVAEEILGGFGAQVDVAENGQLAVQMFEEKPENYYDFILMDIQMPVMDGREATETIRQLNRPDAQTVLIFGLSADAFVEDERKSIACGMNGHYAKPIDFEALQRNIGSFLNVQKK